MKNLKIMTTILMSAVFVLSASTVAFAETDNKVREMANETHAREMANETYAREMANETSSLSLQSILELFF